MSGLPESVGGTPIEGNAPGDAGPPGQPHVQSGKVAREITDDIKCLPPEKAQLLNSLCGIEVTGGTEMCSHPKCLKPRPENTLLILFGYDRYLMAGI